MTKHQFDFLKWKKRILKLKDPATHKEAVEFWSLVDGLENADDITGNQDVAQTLFQTFTNKPDHGIKETVVRTLELFDLETYYRAYLEELPYLFKNTQISEWYFMLADYPAHDLSSEDVDHIFLIYENIPKDNQELFESILEDEEFLEEYDWAEYILGKLKSKSF